MVVLLVFSVSFSARAVFSAHTSNNETTIEDLTLISPGDNMSGTREETDSYIKTVIKTDRRTVVTILDKETPIIKSYIIEDGAEDSNPDNLNAPDFTIDLNDTN